MWYTATSASVSNGATVVAITTGDDISVIQEDSGLIFEGESPVQVKRGYIDGSGGKFIELEKPWPYTGKNNQPLVSFPTDASFAEATAELRRVIDTLSVASTTEAQVGNNDEKIMTPLKTKQAISSQTGTAATRDVVTSATDNTTGAVITVGHGGTGSVSMNLEDAFESGISGFARCSATTTNLPLATVYNWAGIRLNGFNSNNGIRMISPLTSSFSRFFLNVKAGNNDNGWVEMYHSGNSVNPLDYGLGSQSAISSFADYNQINAGGFGFFVPTSEGNPLGSSISVLNMPSNVGNSSYRIIGRYATNHNKIYVESVNAGVSRGVDEILHTGNSNLDDFHSDGVAGNLIAVGEVVSPTILRFYMPLNSKTRPTGITVTSTFSAYKQGGGLISNTNQITLNAGLSSSKVGVLEISGSGFTTGDNINLRASTTTSSIRFNF